MKLRTLVPFALAGIAGVLPHSPPDLRLLPAIANYIVAPAMLAAVVAVLYRSWTWLRSMLPLAGCLLLAQLWIAPIALRLSWQVEEGEPLRAPEEPVSKVLFLLALALSSQVAAALLAFFTTRAFLHLAAQQAAAADAPKAARG
jgi:hypothetical protein